MRLAGYAAIFDAPDRGGDMVRKGAFARIMEDGAAKTGVPLLWQHDAARRIGFVESLSEDEHGLRIIATMDGKEPIVRKGAGCLSVTTVQDDAVGMDFRAQISTRALQHLGVPFCLHGRDAVGGFDCVGLVADVLLRVGFDA